MSDAADFMFCFGCKSAGASSSALLTSLASYWNLDEASGSRADSLGTNALAQTGGVLAAAGIIGNAASFVAASSQFLSNLTPSGLQCNVGSMSFWFNATDIAANYLFLALGDAAGNNEVSFSNSGAHVVQALGDIGGVHKFNMTGNSFAAGAWHHVVCTWGPLGALLYMDGAQVNSTAGDTTLVLPASPRLYLGREVWAASGFYNGLLDEVGIWNGRQLALADAVTLYNGGAGITYPFTGH